MKRILSMLICTALLLSLSVMTFADTSEAENLIIVFEDGSQNASNLLRAIDISDATVQVRAFADNRNSNNATHSLFVRCSIIGYGTSNVEVEVRVYKGSTQVGSTITRDGETQTVAQFRLDSGTTGYQANATYTYEINATIIKNGVTQTKTYTSSVVLDTSNATAREPSNYGQSKTLWCWAASAICVAENNFGITVPKNATVLTNQSGIRYTLAGYNNGSYTTTYAQSYVVGRIKNNDMNDIGSDKNKQDALELLSEYSSIASTVGLQGSDLTTTQLNDLKAELAAGNYVIGNLYASGFGGHSVVIKGYRASDNKFRIYDPWDETDMYYSANTVFYGTGFPVSGCYGKIQWLQYCS